MTIEELKKTHDGLKRMMIAMATYTCDGKRVIEILTPAISLIDEKISQLSVTDEDVKEAIEWLKSVKEHSSVVLDEIKQNEPNVSPMLYEKRKKHASVLITALQQMQPVSGDTSDGYHTFNELYHHRAILFSILCKAYPDKAWRSKKHSDGSMFGDNWFICGIETPQGQYSYHYELSKYWDIFESCRTLEFAPEWDGHEPKDVDRLLSLQQMQKEPHVKRLSCWYCTGIESHGISTIKTVTDEFGRELSAYDTPYNYCPNCGRKLR